MLREPAVTADAMNAALDLLLIRILEARQLYPLDDYAGRVYFCEPCRSVDCTCAPRAHLVDDYPCPGCGRPQTPWSTPGVPGQ